jgi:hypothetical protein
MYWALTGYVGGFSVAFVLHSLAVGHFTFELLWIIPFFVVFFMLVGVDVEPWVLSRWGDQIAQRRAVGILTWRFCLMLGAGFGAAMYPLAAWLWHLFLDDDARGHGEIGIALITVSMGAGLFLMWYLLTRYPKSNSAT